MVNIGGDEISGATIDGDDVKEITIDGDVAWVAETVYEDFEAGSAALNNYTATTYPPENEFDVNSTAAHQGSYGLHGNKGSSSGPRIAIHESLGISRGGTYSYLYELGSGVTFGDGFSWAIQSTSANQNSVEGYQLRCRTDLDGGRFQFFRINDGHHNMTFIDEDQSPSINAGNVYRVEFDYANTGGTHNFRLYDYEGGDNLIGSFSASDDTYTGGNIAWFQIENGSTDVRWDYLRDADS